MSRGAKIAAGGAVLFAAGLVLGFMAARQLALVPRDVPSVAVYDDWRLACPPAGSKKPCVARQDVVDGKSGAHVATLSLAGKALTIVVPFNVLIASQLGLAVADGKPRLVPYTTCTDAGCVASMTVDDALRASLRHAERGRILFARMDQQTEQVGFSLHGFARADDAAQRAAGFWGRL